MFNPWAVQNYKNIVAIEFRSQCRIGTIVLLATSIVRHTRESPNYPPCWSSTSVLLTVLTRLVVLTVSFWDLQLFRFVLPFLVLRFFRRILLQIFPYHISHFQNCNLSDLSFTALSFLRLFLFITILFQSFRFKNSPFPNYLFQVCHFPDFCCRADTDTGSDNKSNRHHTNTHGPFGASDRGQCRVTQDGAQQTLVIANYRPDELCKNIGKKRWRIKTSYSKRDQSEFYANICKGMSQIESNWAVVFCHLPFHSTFCFFQKTKKTNDLAVFMRSPVRESQWNLTLGGKDARWLMRRVRESWRSVFTFILFRICHFPHLSF